MSNVVAVSLCFIVLLSCLKTSPSYLQLLAILVINGHGHLHVLGCGLAPFVKIPLNQRHVDVVPNVTFKKQREV